jgi:hypothetical protein
MGSAAKPGTVAVDGVGAGKLNGLFAAALAGAGAFRGAGAGAADAGRSRVGAAVVVGAGAEAAAEDDCGGGGAIRTGVPEGSAGLVTVPDSEKSRSCAGPTVSA